MLSFVEVMPFGVAAMQGSTGFSFANAGGKQVIEVKSQVFALLLWPKVLNVAVG